MKGVKRVFGIMIVSLLLISSISLISAGFLDIFKFGDEGEGLEGELADTSVVQLNIANPIAPPEIVYISDIDGALDHTSVSTLSRDLTEDTTVAKMFEFYVWSESLTSLPTGGAVTDANTLLILDDGTTQRKSSDGGVAVTCAYIDTVTPPAGATAHSADNTYRYRCSVGMAFYDDYGTSGAQNWDVEAWIKDSLNQEEGYIFGTRTYANSGNSESQYARTTYFNRLEEYKITPAANLDFGDVVYGLQTTKPTTNPLKIVNIGNYDIDRVDVIGYNIPGSVRSGELILSEWFRSSSASSVCTTGQFLNNGQIRQVITSNIVPGPSSESNLEFCLTDVQVSAGQQAYQTTVNPWNLEGVYS